MRQSALPSSCRAIRPRVALVHIALVLAALALAAVSASAQNPPEPDQPPAAPPPPVEFASPIPSNELAFLNDYASQTSKDLWKDKRFKAILKAITPRTEYHYGRDMPLADTLEDMLTGDPLPIEIRDGRYVLVTSRGGPILHGRGFVWFDMQTGVGLGGVYFHPTNGEPTPTLAIFSRQLKLNDPAWSLKQIDLAWSQLPLAFRQDVADWSRSSGVPLISVTYFIPDNGRKYALLHDGDYCVSDSDPDRCQQRNADAADADMNAAYFMQETHNAANATAWMLGSDQVAWIGVRDSTCGGSLGCRIQITRRRTRELLRR
jgi:uncharacterized protein YecT (DUF1311 family)